MHEVLHHQIVNLPLEKRGKTGVNKFDNEVAWARQSLVEAGIIDNTVRGLWTLSAKGKELDITDEIAANIYSECIASRKQNFITTRKRQIKWVVPCNPHQYDLERALKDSPTIYWRQSARFQKDDIIYIYVSKEVAEIRYKCLVEEIDQEYDNTTDPYWADGADRREGILRSKLRLLKSFPEGTITLSGMKQHGLKGNIQGPRTIQGELEQYIESAENNCTIHNINSLVKPVHIEYENELTMFLCGNCGYKFRKAPRCPECGQLHDYEE